MRGNLFAKSWADWNGASVEEKALDVFFLMVAGVLVSTLGLMIVPGIVDAVRGPLSQGTIVDLSHEERSVETRVILIPHIMTTGKTTSTTMRPQLMTIMRPERWVVTIEGKHPKLEEVVRREVSISEEVFNTIQMGDHFEVTPDDLREVEVVKRLPTAEELDASRRPSSSD